ncbi:MAG: hypothetical protein AAB696_00230 [Patescibacteria group bacterium]
MAVFYSYGWRINSENCSLPISRQIIAKLSDCFQKTGGLFIETKPKGVLIKIDNKVFKDKSGIIQSGTLINNLLPKNYKIKIEKEGYLSYKKNIEIKSNLVAEIPNTVLIPEKLLTLGEENPLIPISKPIDNFWINSQQKIVFSAEGGSASGGKSNKVLYYLEGSNPSKLKGNKFINFSESGEKIIISDSSGKNSKNQIYYLYDLNDLSKTVNLGAVFNNLKKNAAPALSDTEGIDEIVFHPADSNRLIISAESGSASGGKDKNLYFLDLNRLRLETIIEGPIFAWTVKNPNIYYIRPTTYNQQPTTNNKLQTTNNYVIASYNLILKTENIIAQLPNFLISQFPNSQIILSPDNKKIAFFNENGEITIYFLEDYRLGINKKAGDVINLNIYKNKKIKNVFWYKDSYHLLVEYINAEKEKTCPEQCRRIDFIEIDDRMPINKYTLIDGSAPLTINYNLKLNRIYFLAEKKLYYFNLE